MKTPLEQLNDLGVASPCTASWDEMAGDDRVRFCDHCSKNVYNLSALTAVAAIDLIREREGDLCGRFFRRSDGTVLTADCPVGLHHRINRKKKWSTLVASIAGIFCLTGAANTSKPIGSSTSNPPTKVEIAEPAQLLKPLIMHEMVLGRINPRGFEKPLAPTPELLPMPRVVHPESESTPR